MLQFIIGKAGTGKTAYLTRLAAQLAAQQAQPLLFLVPEQASFDYEKRMLRALGPRDAQRVEVLSFSRLAETFLPGGQLPPVDDAGRAVIMSLALESLAGRLEVYGRYAKSLSVANELLKLSSEFKRCMLTPAAVQTIAGGMEDCFLKHKLREIGLILETYDALVAQSYCDDTDTLTRLADWLPENPVLRGRIACIDAFNHFTVQEYAVIERMLTQCETVYVSLCTDSVFSGKSYDTGAFAFVRRTAQRLMHAARKHSVPIGEPVTVSDTPHRFHAEPLRAVEHIFAGDTQMVWPDAAPQITIATASGLHEECAFVAAEVKRLMREENYRCRDIAVLFRDAAIYESPIRAALVKCGVPIFEDKRQPILTQPLISLVRGLCAAASQGITTENLMQMLKTGLTDFTTEEIALLENYALLWNLRARHWREPFTAHPDGLGESETQESMQHLETLNALRVRLIEPLEQFCARVRETTGRQFAEAIYRFLLTHHADAHLLELAKQLETHGEPALALEQARMWDLLMEILDLFAHTLEHRTVTVGRFTELFDVVLRTKTLGSIPQGLDEVTVGDLERTVTDSPRAVFLLGATEGVFPRTPSSGGLLTTAERKTLREMQVELYDFGEIKVSEERFLVYKTLCSAAQRLTITTCAVADDGSAQCASEIVRTVRGCFPQCTVVDVRCMETMRRIESASTAFEQLCLHARKADDLYPELYAHFAADEHARARLQALDRVCRGGTLRIENPALAERLFGKNMFLSASRVESYYKCPFAYYCKFGLLAKPRKTAQFDPAIQGTEIHFVLEMLLRRHGREGLLAMTREQRQAQIDALLDAYLAENLSGAEQTKRFMYLYNRLRKTMGEIVERLVLEFAVCSFEPVDFELKIDRDGEIPPYTTPLPEGGSVQIKGSIDRVDKLELNGKTYIRIVDYKSGGKTFALSDVLGGLNMQMLIYLFAVWQNGEDYYGSPIVPAGILYMPAKAQFEKLSRDLSDDAAAMAKAHALRMNGMLLDDSVVLLHMDSGESGCFIPVDKKSRSNTLISLHRLAVLKKETERLLREMARNLRAGRIDALPARNNKDYNACTFCDYRSVCAREDDMPEREIEKIPHQDCLEILDEREEGQVQTDAVDA
ncbi:MAG: PD-(D/E)XK nuclease family protein [Clostridia bacterium]|nr:PD-(D/E)XK nuclease family protein [Clostridia bacterium]